MVLRYCYCRKKTIIVAGRSRNIERNNVREIAASKHIVLRKKKFPFPPRVMFALSLRLYRGKYARERKRKTFFCEKSVCEKKGRGGGEHVSSTQIIFYTQGRRRWRWGQNMQFFPSIYLPAPNTGLAGKIGRRKI